MKCLFFCFLIGCAHTKQYEKSTCEIICDYYCPGLTICAQDANKVKCIGYDRKRSYVITCNPDCETLAGKIKNIKEE